MVRVHMLETWFRAGKPEYQAGKEYVMPDALAQRFVGRGIATTVQDGRESVPVRQSGSRRSRGR